MAKFDSDVVIKFKNKKGKDKKVVLTPNKQGQLTFKTAKGEAVIVQCVWFDESAQAIFKTYYAKGEGVVNGPEKLAKLEASLASGDTEVIIKDLDCNQWDDEGNPIT